MKALNLGCGNRFHPGWTNLDFVASRPGVRACDLSHGIPFPDGEFDLVYHSHLLEHFSRTKGLALLRDCFRVSRSGGLIRVAVPDLEQIARVYLTSLERSLAGDFQWMRHYEWIMLELYDQSVRERSGGDMIDYLRQDPLPNEDFILQRNGSEVRQILSQIRSDSSISVETKRGHFPAPLAGRVISLLRQSRQFLFHVLLGESDYQALQLGRFRRGGEVHRWMYDRYSLGQALEAAGFEQARVVGAAESRIPTWADFGLDTEEDGTTYKPDSLYMEAIRP